MIRKSVSWPQRLAAAALLLLVGACALPNDPAREAVHSVREQKQDIPYQDAETAGNTSLFGFRSLPKRAEAPAVSVSASRSVAEVSQCLQGQLKSRFKLPEDFFQVKNYANKAQSVSLVNPFTKKEGLMMDVEPVGVNGSTIKLYANGATLSKAWQQLPGRCGGANAAVLAKAETPEKTAAESRRNRDKDGEAAAPARNNTVRAQADGTRRQAASAASGNKTKAAANQASGNKAKAAAGKGGNKTDKRPAVKPADKKTKDAKARDSKTKDAKTKGKDTRPSKDTKAKADKTAPSGKSKTKDNKAAAAGKSKGKDAKAAVKNNPAKAADKAAKSGKKDAATTKPKPKNTQQKKGKS